MQMIDLSLTTANNTIQMPNQMNNNSVVQMQQISGKTYNFVEIYVSHVIRFNVTKQCGKQFIKPKCNVERWKFTKCATAAATTTNTQYKHLTTGNATIMHIIY